MTSAATLYHYTCAHSRLTLGNEGVLRSPRSLGAAPTADWSHDELPMLDLIWLTDLDWPHREALGLTSQTIACDRTEFRYRVTDDLGVRRWVDVRRNYPAPMRRRLEHGPQHVLPLHWWISRSPVPVVFDPIDFAVDCRGAVDGGTTSGVVDGSAQSTTPEPQRPQR